MTKKFLKVTVTVLLLVMTCTFVCHGASYESHPGYNPIPAEMLMEGVDPMMLSASFWSSFPGNNQVLMRADEIQAFNNDCLDNPDCNMNRLELIEPVYDGIKMRKNLSGFSSTKNLFLNGKPVPAAFYEDIRAQITGANVSSAMNVGYGICINRCAMKSLPCEQALADDVTDPEWDELALSPVLYNEPVVVYFTTANGKFTYIKSVLSEGWVPTDCIVLCHSKEEWLAATNPENFIIVTGDRIQTENSYNAAHSNITLEMGNKLELCYGEEGTVDNRMNWYNLVVYAPGRGSDGLYEKQKMLIPAGSDVHIGYLPLTYIKLIEQAFKSLGTRYGWGGSELAQDCSSYVREVYQCFGICLPRNTTWQGAVNTEKIDLSSMSAEKKKKALADLPVGSILQFPGHEMIYLGTKKGKFYTINDVSSLAKDTDDGLKKMRVRSVVINSLEDTKRTNGKTWFEELNKAIIICR